MTGVYHSGYTRLHCQVLKNAQASTSLLQEPGRRNLEDLGTVQFIQKRPIMRDQQQSALRIEQIPWLS